MKYNIKLEKGKKTKQRVRAPPVSGTTVHNPRTLAATSDPGTHDPTAATPAGGP
jgi:hypothetical protein